MGPQRNRFGLHHRPSDPVLDRHPDTTRPQNLPSVTSDIVEILPSVTSDIVEIDSAWKRLKGMTVEGKKSTGAEHATGSSQPDSKPTDTHLASP